MAKTPPGWYPIEGRDRRWDGRSWTEEVRPLSPPAGTPPGWYQDSPATSRWWTGSEWSPARVAHDGHVDVKQSIGQSIIAVAALGGVDQTAITKLFEVLEGYPPSRVEQVQTYHSGFAAGTNLVAIVSWKGPDPS